MQIPVPNSDAVAALFQAALRGDTRSVEIALQGHPQLGLVRHKTGRTVLMIAAERGHVGVVQALIPHSKVMAQDSEGLDALMLAALGGSAACVEALLPHSNPGAKDRYDTSALAIATSKEHLGCVKLLAPRSDLHLRSQRFDPRLSALSLAAKLGHEGIVRELLAAHLQEKPEYAWGMEALDGSSPLVLAAGEGRLGALRALLPSLSRHIGLALDAAAQAGQAQALELLIKHWAQSDPNSTSEKYGTLRAAGPKDALRALQTASAHGQLDCVKLLVQSLDPKVLIHSTALVQASANGQLDCVRFLLDHCDPQQTLTGSETTALMVAAARGHRDCVELLSPTQRLHARNRDDETALALAAQHGQIDCVRFLFELGGDPLLGRDKDSTALVQAAKKGQLDCVRILVQEAPVRQLATAFTIAAQNGQWDCARFLGEELPLETMTALSQSTPFQQQQAELVSIFEQKQLRATLAQSGPGSAPSPATDRVAGEDAEHVRLSRRL